MCEPDVNPSTSGSHATFDQLAAVITVVPSPGGKYARVERERRFLLSAPPPASAVTGSRRITDRYLPGTRLRLRRVDFPCDQASEFKFTQKVPAGRAPYRG